MIKAKSLRNVLLVSENKSFYESLKAVLPPDEFEISYASSCGMARRHLVNVLADIIIVDMPLPDEHGLLFAKDFINYNIGILLICPADVYESIANEAEQIGILVMANPCPPAFVYVAAKMMSSLVSRLEMMDAKIKSLEEKMSDFRIINKAKWMLIEKKGMTESEAHKHIEKSAMNKRITSREAAEEILELLE